MTPQIKLRALERGDLKFVHDLNNNRRIMTYWFEEPYESFIELEELYMKHIHDQTERRFIIQDTEDNRIGLVEIVEITHISRKAEFQIIIAPAYQGKRLAHPATRLAMDYAFRVLNLHKLYLVVATDNERAIKVYKDCGFLEEGLLIDEFFVNGAYEDAIRMYHLQTPYLAKVSDT
jgi:diamine N-acetyltransferase